MGLEIHLIDNKGFQDNKNDVTGVLNQRPPSTDPALFGIQHSKPSLLSPGLKF